MRHTTRPRRSHRLGSVTILVLLTFAAIALPATAEAAGGTSTTPPGQAWLRVGHFVPGMGTTSVVLQPQGGGAAVTLARGATYGAVSSYEKIPPGSYTVTVQDAAVSSAAAPLLSRSVEVTAGQARTVAIVGSSDQPRLALLTDDLTPPTAGTARIRLLSASAAAGPVTVQAVGGPTIADQAVLGQASAYATVPAGSWSLQLSGATATATRQAVPVAGGSVYTVVVLDAKNQGPSGVRLKIVTDAAGAVVMPQGGAATGGGGTAPRHAAASTGSSSLLAAVAALVAGAVLVGSRRRPRGER